MWIKLIFLNIGNFLKNKPVLFVFIIISQIICIISAFTVAGMMDAVTQPPDAEDDRAIWEKAFQVDFGNYNYEDSEKFLGIVFDSSSGKIVYRGTDETVFSEYQKAVPANGYLCYGGKLPSNLDELPKYKDFKEKLDRILKAVGTHYLGMCITGYVPKEYFRYYSISGEEAQYYPDLDKNGITFSIEESLKNMDIGINEGGTLKLGNTEYKINQISYGKNGNVGTEFIMRSEDIDDTFTVIYMRIQVDDTLTGDELGIISDMIQKEFQGMTTNFEEPKPNGKTIQQYDICRFIYTHGSHDAEFVKALYIYPCKKKKYSLYLFTLRRHESKNLCHSPDGNHADTDFFVYHRIFDIPFRHYADDRYNLSHISCIFRFAYMYDNFRFVCAFQCICNEPLHTAYHR